MKKLFFLIALMSFESFAGTVLLEKHRTSGYTLPEHRFVKDCRIYSEGYVESHTKNGDGTDSGFTHHVSFARVFEIRGLIRLARKASIADGGIRCDGGDDLVTGFIGKKAVMIRALEDCQSYEYRQGWAARRLLRIASGLCGF
jgi:hypothetical protein